jgi:hypothetical protein
MTSRRAFLAGLAAMAAPLFARLALPPAPERKLLGEVPHEMIETDAWLARCLRGVDYLKIGGRFFRVLRIDGDRLTYWGPLLMTEFPPCRDVAEVLTFDIKSRHE